MVVLVTWKNEEDPIKIVDASVDNIIHQFLRCSKGAYSIIGYGILMKFKLIQAFIVVLLICKDEEDQFKVESTRVITFLPK